MRRSIKEWAFSSPLVCGAFSVLLFSKGYRKLLNQPPKRRKETS